MIRGVRPILLNNGNPQNNSILFRAIQKKFLVLGAMMLFTVLLTGIGNVVVVVKNFSGAVPPMKWMMLLTVKIFLAMVLFAIFGVNYFSIKSQPDENTEKSGMFLPKTALVLGLVIITIGVILHTRLAY